MRKFNEIAYAKYNGFIIIIMDTLSTLAARIVRTTHHLIPIGFHWRESGRNIKCFRTIIFNSQS